MPDAQIAPLTVRSAHSAFFGDPDRFPPGSISVDGAFLMRDVLHEWQQIPDLPALAIEAFASA